MSIVVGIGGGSGAGKSTLLRRVVQFVGPSCVIDLDSYYVDRGHLPVDARWGINYDSPAAFDLPLILEHVSHLAGGIDVRKPMYSFESHTRVGFEPVAAAPLVLVEGLFPLWWEELRCLLHLKLFVDADADVRLLRRIARDVAERGRSIESVACQYLKTVRPMHERYVEPSRSHADAIVDNTADVGRAASEILQLISAFQDRQRLLVRGGGPTSMDVG